MDVYETHDNTGVLSNMTKLSFTLIRYRVTVNSVDGGEIGE